MTKPQKLTIRPYARLLAMLGDQLIKNERIALAELVKNAYDADADWAQVKFTDFTPNINNTSQSKLVIEDNGHGMTEDVIKKVWMTPATPFKLGKNQESRLSPEKKRVMQGEKGIGRFSMLKLGQHIQIVTRPKGELNEYVITLDFTAYDPEFTRYKGNSVDLFLDQIQVDFTVRTPQVFVKRKVRVDGKDVIASLHGTRIEIANLKGRWTESKINDLCNDTLKLQSVFSNLFTGRDEQEGMRFEVSIMINNQERRYRKDIVQQLKSLIENSAVLKVSNGCWDNERLEFRFALEGKQKTILFSELRGDTNISKRFGREADENKRIPACGNFEFAFYVFDLKADAESKYNLTKDEVSLIKGHRVYLYRDGVRVYPYGDPEDDWLGIDITRGTISASAFLSNDQVIGCIDITHNGNPDLRDKTSREGLIDEGEAADDFRAVIRAFLSYLRKQPFTEYRQLVEKRRLQKAIKEGRTSHTFTKLLTHLDGADDKKGRSLALTAQRAYKTEKQILEQRAKVTEDLAAVGIAVETSSHDLMLMLGRALAEIDSLTSAAMVREEPLHSRFDDLQKVRGMLSFVEQRMKDMQSLFKSSKQRRRPIAVRDILDKVVHFYRNPLNEENVKLDIQELGPPLIVKCTDAVLMQLFINLFDNAIYWLRDIPQEDRKITIQLDGDEATLVFADSGPGIIKDMQPYVFDSFVSGKGDDGRGLGLYIARQLLERLDYSIEIAETRRERILNGACFVISFVQREND